MCELDREDSATVVLLWTDPGLKSGISVQDLISTLKKRAREREREKGAGGE